MTAKFLLWPALLLGLLAAPVRAQTTDAVDCRIARDPARCEAHQAALNACADQRGRKKMACINERLPPVDCSQAADPARCAAKERAKQTCQGKTGKALKACLGDSGAKVAGGKKKPKGKAPKRSPSK